MKTAILFFAVSIVIFAGCYSIAVFTALDPNPSNWHPLLRFLSLAVPVWGVLRLAAETDA